MDFHVERLKEDSGVTLVNDLDGYRLFVHVELLPKLIKAAREALRNASKYAKKQAPAGDNLCWYPVEIMGSRFPCGQPKGECLHGKQELEQGLTEQNWKELREVPLREPAYPEPVPGESQEVEEPQAEQAENEQESFLSPVATEVEAEPGDDDSDAMATP